MFALNLAVNFVMVNLEKYSYMRQVSNDFAVTLDVILGLQLIIFCSS